MQFQSKIYRCPLCDIADAVIKVSSAVEAGTASHTSYHATTYMSGFSVRGVGTGSSSGTSTTALARKLAPPLLPQHWSASSGYTVLVALVVLFIIFPGLMCGINLIRVGAYFGAGTYWAGILIALVSGGAITLFVIDFVRATLRRKKMRPVWEQAMIRWNNLYYCARNDVVFFPGSPVHYVPASHMYLLLFPQQETSSLTTTAQQQEQQL